MNVCVMEYLKVKTEKNGMEQIFAHIIKEKSTEKKANLYTERNV